MRRVSSGSRRSTRKSGARARGRPWGAKSSRPPLGTRGDLMVWCQVRPRSPRAAGRRAQPRRGRCAAARRGACPGCHGQARAGLAPGLHRWCRRWGRSRSACRGAQGLLQHPGGLARGGVVDGPAQSVGATGVVDVVGAFLRPSISRPDPGHAQQRLDQHVQAQVVAGEKRSLRVFCSYSRRQGCTQRPRSRSCRPCSSTSSSGRDVVAQGAVDEDLQVQPRGQASAQARISSTFSSRGRPRATRPGAARVARGRVAHVGQGGQCSSPWNRPDAQGEQGQVLHDEGWGCTVSARRARAPGGGHVAGLTRLLKATYTRQSRRGPGP
jgi:hypothetical protein